ncbi:OmpA family protein [Thermochromatium tepidum]|jgi:Outer membrane protein and related peptidoglycan-associated (lipo)proteins|uniref:OmpA family protein n=1 Tax=Thermochromatium tepidum ATCC 43061 TaxID=316276 RepID=A0A6I6EF74_THETI|nr:OmpA family protein [Thermochromatium tepidum]QGU32017.1 OmpA family protein [Thermochromatium tepidum ATCC 43061]
MKKAYRVSVLFVLVLGLWISTAGAEEYMKRGASVDDYEKALNRVMERKRGLITGRERQSTSASQSKPEPTERTAPVQPPTPPKSRVNQAATQTPRVRASGPAAADVYQPPASESGASDGVSIYFGYDSSRLTETSMAELAKLGQALKRPQFSGVTWLIEGHTDASGSEEYNQSLSEQRARAAERYLMECCGIEPSRLIAVGKGESELYAPDRPLASVNRRVRVRPIGD